MTCTPALLLAFAATQEPAAEPPSEPAPAAQFEVVVLEHAAAPELAPILADLVGNRAEVTADERTNSLLLHASTAELHAAKDLIAALDVAVAPAQGPDDLFPMPSGDLTIPVGEEGTWKLAELVREYARLTDQHFVIDAQTSQFLGQTSTGLVRSVVVPKAEVQSFVEQVLVESDFVMTILRDSEPRLLAIVSLNTGARQTLRTGARFVPAEQLGAWSEHPSLLVTTVMHLPNTDVRQLSNSMRTMITDANTQQMLPAGNTNSMVLTGFAPHVAQLAEVLRITDEASKIEQLAPGFKRFPLQNAVAQQVADPIEELVNASTRRSAGPSAQGPPQTLSPHGHVDARIMIDARTNALVVMAMPYDMSKVAELVTLFDVAK